MERDAIRDDVTGLLGRRGFLQALDEALAERRSTTVILLGLEHFDAVNAVHGRAVGDQLLRAIGMRLTGRLRLGDRAGRVGGDVFGVVCRGVAQDEAADLAQLLQEAVVRSRAYADIPASVRACAGIAEVPVGGGLDAVEALMRADLALHEARVRGYGAVVRYPPTGESAFARGARFTWGRRLYTALERRGLRLHAAPIIGLRDRSVAGYELDLVLSDGGEQVEGDAIRRQARAAGLGESVDRWAVSAAVEWAARWRYEIGEAFAMVPVDASMLADRSLVAQLEDELGRLAVDPRRIVLALDDADDVRAIALTAEALRAIGIGLALRGFPVRGLPTPALERLPLTVVELDPMLARAASVAPCAADLVERVVAFAHDEDLLVVAAGLQSEEEADALAQLGVAAG